MRRPWSIRRVPSDAEIARELRDHVELEARALEMGGMDSGRAALEARRRFGNVTGVQETVRDASASRWFERLAQDLRFGMRMLRRAPIFTMIAVASLGLGIGANALVLSWTDSIVHHPFPGVRDQDNLVAVAGTAKGASGYDEMSWPDFIDITRQSGSFSTSFVSKITGAIRTGGERAERLVGQMVTSNYFEAIGVHPLLGRGFLSGEDVGAGAHPVTVISYRLWQDRFGASQSITDSTVSFNGVPHTIVGVTPPEFLGTFVGYAMQFWVPASQQAVFDPSGDHLEDRSARWVEGFARLAPGVSLAAGQAQASAAALRLAAAFPDDDRGRGVRILPLDQNPFDNAQDLEPMLRVAAIVAVLILVIVSANVANLLLVRSMARRPELTVRRALGAGRTRLIRQLVTEGLILAVAGTGLGIGGAYAARHMLGLFFAPRGGVNLVFAASFSWHVILTGVTIGLGSTLVFALAPALPSTRVDIASAMRAAAPGAIGTGSRSRVRNALVLVQMSLSVVLLVGAGLVVRSLHRFLSEDPGFSTTNVTTTTINLFAAGYDTARAHRFEDDILRSLRSAGGMGDVALARSVPFSTRPYDNGPIVVDGYILSRDERPTADYNAVSPGYFGTLGIPLLAGRDFGVADTDNSAPVAIVTRALADRYWPHASPVGMRLQLNGSWTRVVGVVGDIKYRSLTESPAMLAYVPLAQQRPISVALFIRTPGDNAGGVVGPVMRAVHTIDPGVSPYDFVTMREQVTRATSGQQIAVTLLTLFAGLALALAAMGLYGVLAFMVSQSTREFGLRMALGATPGQLVSLVMSSGMRLTFTGIGLGVAVALGTTRFLGDLLFRVGPHDPAVFAIVVVIMTVASAAACLLPGWRASKLDPVRALRL